MGDEEHTVSTLGGAEEETLLGPPRREVFAEDEAALFDPENPKWIGRYVPLRRVGSGAFGAIYQAYDPQLDRKVALKLLRAGRRTANNRLRLLREARAVAAISHPNVVSVFDVGERDGGGAIHIAMEFIEGTSFRHFVEKTRPTARRLLSTLVAVGRGLEAAHAAGLAHRDIKPDNIMVNEAGIPKIVDFGLAHAGHADSEESGEDRSAPRLDSLTATGMVVGTPAYMAPEQHRGHRGGPPADQFSFSVVAYEAFVGERPFAGKTMPQLRVNLFEGKPKTPQSGRMPRWLWPVLQRGLSIDPAERFGSMAEMLEEIERRRRRPRRIAFAALAALAVGVPVAAAVGGSTQPCDGAGAEIEDVWDRGARRAITTSFVEARPEFGPAAAERVTRFADDYALRWRAGARANCEATRIHAAQSDELFDLRAACYRDGLSALKETVALWEDGEPTVVDRAVAAATALPDPDDCAHTRAFRGLQPRPRDPEALAEIGRLEDELARARAHWRSGRRPEALLELEARAADLGYRPLQARVRLLAASVNRFSGGVGDLDWHAALTTAIAGGDTRIAIQAGLRLCTTYRAQHENQHASDACDLVEALMETEAGESGESERLELKVLRAELAFGDGDLERARSELLAVRSEAEALGADRPRFDAITALARVEQSRGRMNSGLELMKEAKALSVEMYGPLHPSALSVEGDLLALMGEAGHWDETRTRLIALIEMENKTRGDDSPQQWQSHMNLSWAHSRLGDIEAAVQSANRARRFLLNSTEYRALCRTLAQRAMILYQGGLVDQAEAAVEESGACLKAHGDRLSPDESAIIYGQMAWFYEQKPDKETAVQYFALAEREFHRIKDVDPTKLMIVNAAQADLLFDLGRTDASMLKAKEALRIATSNPPAQHPLAREGIEHLGDVLEKVGLTHEAASVRELEPTELE